MTDKTSKQSQTTSGRDSLASAGRRLLRVGWQTGLARDFVSSGVRKLLGEVVRHGLNVRNVHAVHAIRHPERLALVDDRRRLTYAELDEEINRIANALSARFGVGSRTPVIIMMENRVEYLATWFALFRLGASGVHASYRMTSDELAYQVEHSQSRVLVVSPTALEAAAELAGSRPDLDLRIVVVDEEPSQEATFSYEALRDEGSTDFATPSSTKRGEAESQNIVYTSGTTGKPKGTVRNFGQFGLVELSRILDRLPLQVADKHLVVAPVYHSGGQVFTLLNTSLAATLFLRPHFDAEDALETLSHKRINSVFMVPTMIRRVLDLPDDLHRRCPTPQLRALVSGAAPFPRALRQRAIDRFGASTVHDFYGATEMGWVTLINGEEMAERPGSVGRPLAGQEVRILDEDGADVPRGGVGKIYVRNQHAMSGYLHDRLASEEIRLGDWVTVDDLGYLDEDDYLYLAGRARDMVITGGVNVYPVEIENVLVQHPSVADAAVVGVLDEEWGERLVAVVVAEDGADVDEEALQEHAREHLASFKVPKQWEQMDEIPRNPTGKILKNELEKRFS